MNAINCSDQELLLDFNNGNVFALETLIKRYERKVYTYVLMMVRKPYLAEDIMQDTFVKVIKSLKQGAYSDDNKFVSWVMRIAHNLVIDHFRRNRKSCEVSNDDFDYDLFNSPRFSDYNVEQKMVYNQVVADLRAIIDSLPMEQREVVLLRYYGDLSFKEIADITDVSINTALGRMRYAIINLRKVIEERKLSLQVSL